MSYLAGQRAMRLIVVQLALTLVLLRLLLCPIISAAQAPAITADGTLGTAVGRLGDAYTIDAGTIKGSNLFHSFGLFNVPTGGSATFLGPSSIANILSRVRGGQQSTIDGLISTRASMPNAHFYLINPSGVVFTSGASLDVGGAFRVSTADNIRLADGAVFSATPVPGEVGLLTSAPPQAFGFLSSAPAPISIQGAFLAVDPGQTLSIVGGNVEIVGGFLSAPGGLVQIGSVASPGDALLSAPPLDLGGFSSLGEVNLSQGAFVTAGSDGILPGGTVAIRSGRLVVDSSFITTSTVDLPGAPVGIDLGATESVAVRNGSVVRTESFGAGDASGISIATGNLEIKDGSAVDSLAFITGRTGSIDIHAANVDIVNGTIRTGSTASAAKDINISASGTVTISGPAGEISTGTGNTSDPEIFGGNISLTGDKIFLSDQARIRSGSVVEQAGQNLSITATDSFTISGLAGISSQAFAQSAGTVDISATRVIMDAGFVNTSTQGVGNAGPVLVNADTLSLTNGAQIASSSQVVATGAGGNITIVAPGSVQISGVGPDDGVGNITLTNDPSSGIFSTASGTGNAGQIAMSTSTLTVADGGKISVATEGAGHAGNILANVSTFFLTGGAQVVSSTSGDGAGGTVVVTAGELVSISGAGSGLFSTASSTGNAGEITVSAPALAPVPTLTMTDNGKISVATSLKESGAGSAGSILLNANNLSLTGGAQVVSSTSGAGQGGSVTVSAPGSLSVSGSETAASGLFSTAESTGSAGQIAVSTSTLTMGDGGTISVATTDIGNAGSISLNVSNFTQTGGARVESSTTGDGAGGTLGLTASELVSISGAGSGLFSTASSTGNAGQITVAALGSTPVPTLTMADGGTISVATSGAGSAGSISLNVSNFTQTGGAQVVSSTTSAGQGGNLTLTATESASSSDLGSGLFSTAAATGAAGQITLSTPTLTLANGGNISVATEGAGAAGNISISVNKLSLAGGAQVVSSTTGDGTGGTLGLTASELVSISGAGSGLFSTASSTGNAGQITVPRRALHPCRH